MGLTVGLNYLLPLVEIQWNRRSHGGEMQGPEFARYPEIEMGTFKVFWRRTATVEEHLEATGVARHAWYSMRTSISANPLLTQVEIEDIFVDAGGKRYYVKEKKIEPAYDSIWLQLEEEY